MWLVEKPHQLADVRTRDSHNKVRWLIIVAKLVLCEESFNNSALVDSRCDSGMMKHVAAVASKVAVIAAIAVLIAGGAIGIYYYTSTPATNLSTSRSTTETGSSNTSPTSSAPASGYQDSTGQPQGAWAAYLGYIPAGYTVAPHYPNAATYPCPSGMDPTQCKQFQASCGNGVCDPNESCATCALDCGVPGQLTCDPYTGRAGAPISICQVAGKG